MKLILMINRIKVDPSPESEASDEIVTGEDVEQGHVSRKMAQRMLYALMFPAVIMPITGSITRVALPIIRNDFMITADMTSWVAAAFTLPFMILMPVYGRLSDAVGRRRLLLLGIAIFLVGTAMVMVSKNLGMLMAGRAIQGVGASGLMPLGMAFITAIFTGSHRGRALGTWSQVGPLAGFFAPLLAGVMIAGWGWHMSFVAPLIVGALAFAVVYFVIPSGLSTIQPGYLRSFDWLGVFFLACSGAGLLFFLSSRPITGHAPLTDWRLLIITVVFFGLLVWWERRQAHPFIPMDVFGDRVFLAASTTGAMRMVTMAGIGFLIPLYLVDVREMSSVAVGIMLVINPGAMALMVRQGGKIADRYGSRLPSLIGLSVQAVACVMFYFLPADVSIWPMVFILTFFGLGSGIMLAGLHRSAMGNTPPSRMGSVAGTYNLVRFTGMACGTALAGVILQHFLDLNIPMLQAYQYSFLSFLAAALLGLMVSMTIKEPTEVQ